MDLGISPTYLGKLVPFISAGNEEATLAHVEQNSISPTVRRYDTSRPAPCWQRHAQKCFSTVCGLPLAGAHGFRPQHPAVHQHPLALSATMADQRPSLVSPNRPPSSGTIAYRPSKLLHDAPAWCPSNTSSGRQPNSLELAPKKNYF